MSVYWSRYCLLLKGNDLPLQRVLCFLISRRMQEADTDTLNNVTLYFPPVVIC